MCHLAFINDLRLAEVEPKFLYRGPLDTFSQEAQLWWDFLRWPHDFCTVRIQQLWRAATPVPVLSRYAVHERKNMREHELQKQGRPNLNAVLTVPSSPTLCWPVICESVLLESKQELVPLSELLEEFAEALPLQAVVLPEPLVRLACAGAFSEIPLLGGWLPQIFPDWPPFQWIQATSCKHAKIEGRWRSIPAQQLFDCTSFQAVATELRESVRANEVLVERHFAETMVQWLDDCIEELSVPHQHSHRGQLESGALLSALQASRLMKSSSRRSLRTLLLHLSELTLAPGLRAAVLQRIRSADNELPGRESIRQAKLSVDATFLLQIRRSGQHITSSKYLWWDTTVKKTFDVLLAQMHMVSEENLDGVWAKRSEVLADSSNANLTDLIDCHTFIPTFIGLRNSSLEAKVLKLCYLEMHKGCSSPPKATETS